MNNSGVIRGARMVGLHSVSEPTDLYFDQGCIREIGDNIIVPHDVVEYPGDGKIILPGFIDIHYHGTTGFDTTFGTYQADQDRFYFDPVDYAGSLRKATAHRRRHGVTKMLLTSMSAPLADLSRSFNCLAQLIEEDSDLRSSILGINLEGTFLKNPAFAGAQNPRYFQVPSEDVYRHLQDDSGGNICIVNVVPEYGEPALDLIRAMVTDGVRVAAGHTGANFRETNQAVEAGLSLGVHFLNGPALSSKKSFYGGGAEEAMLSNDDLSLELILDGYHVHAAYVRDVIARKEDQRVIGISDAMFATGLSLTQFTVAGLRGSMSDDGKYLQSIEDPNSLFGSVLDMDQGYSNLVTWLTNEMPGFWTRQHPALDLDQALSIASRICSTNPANYLGILEPAAGPGTGSIAVGKKADLILAKCQLAEDSARLECQAVFTEGQLVA